MDKLDVGLIRVGAIRTDLFIRRLIVLYAAAPPYVVWPL